MFLIFQFYEMHLVPHIPLLLLPTLKGMAMFFETHECNGLCKLATNGFKKKYVSRPPKENLPDKIKSYFSSWVKN